MRLDKEKQRTERNNEQRETTLEMLDFTVRIGSTPAFSYCNKYH